ncbi:PEP-CTERM sorting domain-containing protein [Pirellulaceae bacterium SH449]
MRSFVQFLALAILATTATSASADLIFSISPATSTVPIGGTLTVDVNFTSTIDNQVVRGIDILVLSGIGDGTQGVFSTGLVNIGDEQWDISTQPGEAFLSFSLSSNFFNTGLANTVHQLGQLTLDLSNVGIGTYLLTIDDGLLLALDPSDAPINTSSVSGSFSVVPEPSSLALLFSAVGLVMARRFRRRSPETDC